MRRGGGGGGGVVTAAVQMGTIQTTDLIVDYLKHQPTPKISKEDEKIWESERFVYTLSSTLLPSIKSSLFRADGGNAFHLKSCNFVRLDFLLLSGSNKCAHLPEKSTSEICTFRLVINELTRKVHRYFFTDSQTSPNVLSRDWIFLSFLEMT